MSKYIAFTADYKNEQFHVFGITSTGVPSKIYTFRIMDEESPTWTVCGNIMVVKYNKRRIMKTMEITDYSVRDIGTSGF
jgi:hypothetical protein